MMLNRTGRDTGPPLGRGQTREGRRAPWGCAAGAPYRGTASPPPPPPPRGCESAVNRHRSKKSATQEGGGFWKGAQATCPQPPPPPRKGGASHRRGGITSYPLSGVRSKAAGKGASCMQHGDPPPPLGVAAPVLDSPGWKWEALGPVELCKPTPQQVALRLLYVSTVSGWICMCGCELPCGLCALSLQSMPAALRSIRAVPSGSDGFSNGNELGLDFGGSCDACGMSTQKCPTTCTSEWGGGGCCMGCTALFGRYLAVLRCHLSDGQSCGIAAPAKAVLDTIHTTDLCTHKFIVVKATNNYAPS